jgi:hypothetical protein
MIGLHFDVMDFQPSASALSGSVTAGLLKSESTMTILFWTNDTNGRRCATARGADSTQLRWESKPPRSTMRLQAKTERTGPRMYR